MSCTTRFVGLPLGLHHWHKEVTHTEILTAREPDMWGRTVLRDYVRCDKRQVCDVCGGVRREVSCLCEPARADKCAIRIDYLAKTAPPQ
jgi:hypothetical protein